jgi:hypothetical protein
VKAVRRSAFSIITLIITLGSVPTGTYGQSEPVVATIEVREPAGKIWTVGFTRRDLDQVASDAKYVWKKMGSATSGCCESARRLSRCIWVCCNDRKIRTCDEPLVKALEELYREKTAN